MTDPRNSDQADGEKTEKAEELPDGSGPASRPDDTGDPDQFQG